MSMPTGLDFENTGMSNHSATDNPTPPLAQHPLFGAEDADFDGMPAAAVDPEPATPRRSSRGRYRTAPQPSRSSGTGLCFIGLLLVLGGLALAVLVTSKPALLGNLTQFLTTGVTPGTIVMAGFALLAAGLAVRANQNDDTVRLEETLVRVEDSVERLAQSTSAIEGDELHRALLLLQRQDEKVNNLTKAIKMYGKPLVELGNASSDTLGSLRDVQQTLKAISEQGGGIEQSLAELAVRVSEVHGRQGKEELLQLLESQESQARAQAAAQEAQQAHAEEIQKLAAGITALRDSQSDSASQDALRRVEARVDQAVAKLDESIAAASAGPDYEDSFRSLQRELQGLATTLGNIQANVNRGGMVASSAPQPTASAPAASGALSSAPAEPVAADGTNKPGPGGLASSNAGTQQAKGGKNVLGAIAKLKQMRN